MCCKNFGIGLIVLSTTLFLGITSSNFLKLENVSVVEVIEENNLPKKAETLKNCVPENGTLNYENLPFSKSDKKIKFQKLPYSPDQTTVDTDRFDGLNVQLVKLEEELVKVDSSDINKVKDIQRTIKLIEREINKYPKLSEKSSFNTHLQKLIHLEKCSDNK